MLDDFYDMFQIIKICLSIIVRNIFWGVGSVFKEIRALFRKKFISLLIISSILQHNFFFISTSPPLPFMLTIDVHVHFVTVVLAV